MPGPPAVLVSLSTFAFPGMADCLQRLLDATATLDARVVVTTGPHVDHARPARAPPTTSSTPFVPHAELMPRVSLVVGHGGHGTTMQRARPRPAAGRDADAPVARPAHGRPVGRAGRRGPAWWRRRPSADELAPVIAGLLADGPHRAAAARLGAAIRAMPGATNAADRDRGRAQGRSSGARSPRGSTVSSSIPSQPASRTSSARQLLGGLERRAAARRTPPSRPGDPTAGRP